jgi:hypothetical protein
VQDKTLCKHQAKTNPSTIVNFVVEADNSGNGETAFDCELPSKCISEILNLINRNERTLPFTPTMD